MTALERSFNFDTFRDQSPYDPQSEHPTICYKLLEEFKQKDGVKVLHELLE